MRRVAIGVAFVAITSLALAGCTKQTTPGGSSAVTAPSVTLPFDAPSASQLASAAGLLFPGSLMDYRSVKFDAATLNVGFTLAANDVDSFTTGSSITLSPDTRLITHSSPVWEQNPAGSISSGKKTYNGLTSTVEVASTGADRVTVRLVVAASGS